MFSDAEVKYLKSQPLARIATVSQTGRPNVVPVEFEFDGTYFYVGSVKQEILRSTPKYKNVKAGNKRVALTIDDLESVDPWKPRGIRINGTADLVERDGEFGKGEYIRITPTVSWSWGIPDAK
jgi:pyridoxamine 5'-phosphate oxidase family protein